MPDPIVAETTRLLVERFGGLHRVARDEQLTLEIGSERHFVQTRRTLDRSGGVRFDLCLDQCGVVTAGAFCRR